MIRSRLVAIAAMGAALAAVSIALGPNDELNAHLKAFVPKVQKAFAKEDVKFFHAISTPDFTYTDAAGRTENKANSLNGMKQMFDMSSGIQAKFKWSGVSVKGSIGTAKFVSDFSMNVQGPDGKPAKMAMTTWTTETYKKVNGKWLVHKIVETKPSKMTMNGKAFDPSKMMAPPPTKPSKKVG